MRKVYQVLGVLGGILLLLSGLAHSAIGWAKLRQVLAPTNIPVDVSAGLAVPWHLAGMGMIFGGILGILTFTLLRNAKTEMFIVQTILAVCYIGFGIWGLAFVKLDPGFAIFMLPGILILVGALGVRTMAAGSTA